MDEFAIYERSGRPPLKQEDLDIINTFADQVSSLTPIMLQELAQMKLKASSYVGQAVVDILRNPAHPDRPTLVIEAAWHMGLVTEQGYGPTVVEWHAMRQLARRFAANYLGYYGPLPPDTAEPPDWAREDESGTA